MNEKLVELPRTFDRPDNLIAYIAWLNTKLLEIPEEYRAKAEVDIDGSDWGVEYSIRYYRKMTEQEIQTNTQTLEANDRLIIAAAKKTLKEFQDKYPELVKL